ncbi:MAG: cobalamin-binding protein [Candidatus Obscuribacterales bacterium]
MTAIEPRIISLIASSTEIVHALGLGHYMVGRSHECDFPESVKSLAVCTSPKFQVDGSSYEIDQRVKAILQESLSVYKVDAAVLESLQPSHVITQAQCEVCAVSLRDVEEALCQMVSSRPQIVSLEPNSLSDFYSDIEKIGKALQVEDRAKELIANCKKRIDAIEAKANEALARGMTKVSVAVIEWIEPLMAAGNWMPELVELAGATNLFGQAGKHSPWMTWEELIEKEPDVIIVTPCGFANKRTLEEMHLIEQQPHYTALKAVRNKRVYVADGNQYFNRPGPRLIDSLEIMAEILYPQLFNFGHEQAAWLNFTSSEFSKTVMQAKK